MISGLASFIQVAYTHLLQIATELGDVILNELQGGPLILQADVQVMKWNMGTGKLRKVYRQSRLWRANQTYESKGIHAIVTIPEDEQLIGKEEAQSNVT